MMSAVFGKKHVDVIKYYKWIANYMEKPKCKCR